MPEPVAPAAEGRYPTLLTSRWRFGRPGPGEEGGGGQKEKGASSKPGGVALPAAVGPAAPGSPEVASRGGSPRSARTEDCPSQAGRRRHVYLLAERSGRSPAGGQSARSGLGQALAGEASAERVAGRSPAAQQAQEAAAEAAAAGGPGPEAPELEAAAARQRALAKRGAQLGSSLSPLAEQLLRASQAAAQWAWQASQVLGREALLRGRDATVYLGHGAQELAVRSWPHIMDAADSLAHVTVEAARVAGTATEAALKQSLEQCATCMAQRDVDMEELVEEPRQAFRQAWPAALDPWLQTQGPPWPSAVLQQALPSGSSFHLAPAPVPLVVPSASSFQLSAVPAVPLQAFPHASSFHSQAAPALVPLRYTVPAAGSFHQPSAPLQGIPSASSFHLQATQQQVPLPPWVVRQVSSPGALGAAHAAATAVRWPLVKAESFASPAPMPGGRALRVAGPGPRSASFSHGAVAVAPGSTLDARLAAAASRRAAGEACTGAAALGA